MNFESYDLPELYRHLPEYVNSITEKRKSKKYNCPLCNSGKRENGTPAFNLYDDGLKCHCHSCGFDGNIVGLYLAVNVQSAIISCNCGTVGELVNPQSVFCQKDI